jgi:hypothetical protein
MKNIFYIKYNVRNKHGEYANRLLTIGFLRKLFGFKYFFYFNFKK